MEGGRQGRYGKQKRGRGPPHRPHPTPDRQLLPAGRMHMDVDIWTRAGSAPRCHRGTQVTREAHGRRAGRSGRWEGEKEELSALRGVTKGSLYSGHVRWGKAQYVGRCHPVPDKALHQRCHSPEAFGLSHSDSNSQSEFPAQAAWKEMPNPARGMPKPAATRDGATISASDGFSRPFPHVWSPVMSS